MRKKKNTTGFLKIAIIVFTAVIIFPSANVKADRWVGIEKNNFKMGVVLSEYDKKTGYTCGIDGG